MSYTQVLLQHRLRTLTEDERVIADSTKRSLVYKEKATLRNAPGDPCYQKQRSTFVKHAIRQVTQNEYVLL